MSREHIALNILRITANLGGNADRDFIQLKQKGKFGNECREIEACADIRLRLSEKQRYRFHIVASAVDKALKRLTLIGRRHVLTLNVFRQCDFKSRNLVHIVDYSRNVLFLCE